MDTPGDGAMAEIPFVPAPLRQSVKAEVVDGAIVVVGQRQKKRKRNKMVRGGDDGCEMPSTPPAHTKAEPGEIVPFDFASVPNILDDAPSQRSGELEDERAGKRHRSRKRLGAALDRESFPATPKDPREVRSGNVSHTFRP